MQKIMPCLWFAGNAEEAVKFYVSVFKNSKVIETTYYPPGNFPPNTALKAGTVLTIHFQLEGCDFLALNAGPHFKFNEAISLMVSCETQAEVDSLWQKLSADPQAEICGWLKDKFGLSWQITPKGAMEIWSGDPKKAGKAMEAMMKMKKLDLAALKEAYNS